MTENLIIKHRYFLTAKGNLRLRFIVPSVLVCLTFLWGGVIGLSSPSNALVQDNVPLVSLERSFEPAAGGDRRLDISNYDPEESGNGLSPYMSRLGDRPQSDKPHVWTKAITVGKGDTLGLLMEETGLEGDAYLTALEAVKDHVDPQSIRPGHQIEVAHLTYKGKTSIEKVSYVLDSLTSIVLSQNDEGTWVAEKKERPVEIKTYAATTVIDNSLFADLAAQGVPNGIISRMIQAYSWTVDFQRDVWGGETVEVLYETKETEDGSYVRSNRLVYANLKLRDRELPIYLFKKSDGFETYFEPDGQSIRRALMRTPVDGARLSSGYGKRVHPVLGYKKMHKGLDFAAPTGTPIYAAGDGVIERANRFGSYGNYVRIRHNDTFKTAYAHLHKFAKGMRAGTRVKQGEVIGYVGSTGRSTGPHLHYEVIKHGRKVNPHSVDLPLGEKLKGTELANFKRQVGRLNEQYASLVKDNPKVAQADIITD